MKPRYLYKFDFAYLTSHHSYSSATIWLINFAVTFVKMIRGGKGDFQIDIQNQEEWEALLSKDGLKGILSC